LSVVSGERRGAILLGIGQLAKNNAPRLFRLLTLAHRHWQDKNVQRMFALLQICVTSEETAGKAAELALQVFGESEFENQYRALRVIATSRVTTMVTFLVEVAHEKNEYLRRLATRALGQFNEDDAARKAIIALSSDPSPGVQMEAMNALLNFSSGHKKVALAHGIKSPWPQVRALAVKNAADVPSVRAELVQSGLADDRYMVVTESIKVAAQTDNESLDAPLRALLTESRNAKLLVQTANAVGARCQSDDATADALFSLLQMGAEPLATSAEKAVGVSAAEALGEIGSPTAIRHLKKARERSNLVTDKAIDAALVSAKTGCVSR
jgi:HEAT repeat protein